MKKTKLTLVLMIVFLITGALNVFAAEQRTATMNERWTERKNSVITEDKEKTTTLVLPPALEKKDLRTIEKNTGANLKEAKGLREDFQNFTGKYGKFNQLTSEVKDGADGTKDAIEAIGKKMDNAKKGLNSKLIGVITLLAILAIIGLFGVVAIINLGKRHENEPDKTDDDDYDPEYEELLAELKEASEAVKKSNAGAAATKKEIIEEIKKVGQGIEEAKKGIQEIPAKTAGITDMWLVLLKNVCGHDVEYYAPLRNGKRLSLRVPNTLTGEFPDPAEIPRISRGKLTEMKSSLVDTLTRYCDGEYVKGSLQRRVIEHAIGTGELVGIKIIE